MKFYFRNQLLDDQPLIQDRVLKCGYDFSLVLLQKLSVIYNDIKMIAFWGQDGFCNAFTQFAIAPEFHLNPIYITAHGQGVDWQDEKLSLQQEYGANNVAMTAVSQPHAHAHLSNIHARLYSKEILKDFCVLQQQRLVKDKFGKAYRMNIVSNSDLTTMGYWQIDELSIFDGVLKVGCLKVKYTTTELLQRNHVSPTLWHEDEITTAVVDFSYIDDSYRGKGLGFLMYFHMAHYLAQHGKCLRQSLSCSSQAHGLWRAIAKSWPQYVEKKPVSKADHRVVVLQLRMRPNLALQFLNHRPIIHRIDKHIALPRMQECF